MPQPESLGFYAERKRGNPLLGTLADAAFGVCWNSGQCGVRWTYDGGDAAYGVVPPWIHSNLDDTAFGV